MEPVKRKKICEIGLQVIVVLATLFYFLKAWGISHMLEKTGKM
jgi:hypothetical protein